MYLFVVFINIKSFFSYDFAIAVKFEEGMYSVI